MEQEESDILQKGLEAVQTTLEAAQKIIEIMNGAGLLCTHIYGCWWDFHSWGMADSVENLKTSDNHVIFAYCPKCGKRLFNEPAL